MASIFTTPPPVRPPPPKHPLFTTKFFSTKSFGPGHVVGAGLLVFGVAAVTKMFLARTRQPSQSPGHTSLATVQNDRGTYGRTP